MSDKTAISRVSVVVPTYNAGEYIGDALRSVYRQTYLPCEIVVVDDGSTDGTPQRVAEVAAESPVTLRQIRLRDNSGGPAHPLNVGIAEASGPLIAVLEQDDLFTPSKLHVQCAILEHEPEIALVFSYCGRHSKRHPARPALHSHVTRRFVRLIRSQGKAEPRRLAPPLQTPYYKTGGDCLNRWLLRRRQLGVGFPGLVFRRRHWEQKGGFDESLRIAADFDFLCWMSLNGNVACWPEIGYLRRIHGGNLSTRSIECRLEVLRILLRDGRRQADTRRSEFQFALAAQVTEIAMCLAAAGQWACAARTLGLLADLDAGIVRGLAARIKLPLYWAYCRGFNRRWSLSDREVRDVKDTLCRIRPALSLNPDT